MSYYESLVDGTNFGLVADYLKSPRSPIEALLHIKDKTLLPKVAEELERELQSGVEPGHLPQVIGRMLEEGAMKLSLRQGFTSSDPRILIDAASVPRLSYCQVIYLPPFYLVHTPDLFEGKILNPLERGQAGRFSNPGAFEKVGTSQRLNIERPI
jgi:hypothetical protein